MATITQNGIPLPDGTERLGESHYYILPDGQVAGTLRHTRSTFADIFSALRSTWHQTDSHAHESDDIHRYPLFHPHGHDRLAAIASIEESNQRDRTMLQRSISEARTMANAIQGYMESGKHTAFLQEHTPYPMRGQQIATLQRTLRNHIFNIPAVRPFSSVRDAANANVAQLHTQIHTSEARALLANTYELAGVQKMKINMETLRCEMMNKDVATAHDLKTKLETLLKPSSFPQQFFSREFWERPLQIFWKQLRDKLDSASQQKRPSASMHSVSRILESNDPLSIVPELMPSGSSRPQHPR